MRRRILELVYPPGRELEEHALVSDLGASRTPVREALIRLASEGLVDMQGGRSARVMPLEVTALNEFFEALDLTQRAVTRLAAVRRREDDIAAIVAACRRFDDAVAQGDGAAMTESNHALHEAIAEAAGNEHLLVSYRRLLTQSLRIVRICFTSNEPANEVEEHLNKTCAEHGEFVEAIRVQDLDRSEAVARSHCELFRHRVQSVLLKRSYVLDDVHPRP
jgi:DNA-binding GntR family transcriptional regulator